MLDNIYENFVEDIVKKYNTKGKITMKGDVYYIEKDNDEKSQREIYTQIKEQFGKHESSGKLPSLTIKEFKEKSKEELLPNIDDLNIFSVGKQDDIESCWNFTDNKNVVEAVINFVEKSDNISQLKNLKNLKNENIVNEIREKLIEYISELLSTDESE